MIYEDPRAYLLGLEGMALLRAFTGIGDSDREFVETRLAEIRSVLADESLADAAVEVDWIDTVTGYRQWAATYDQPNSAFDADEALVLPIIDSLPAGVALDAACGTGRYAQFLAERGHQIIGVDGSPEMVARARVLVPKGTFVRADLDRLPVADDSVELVVCTLALTHVRDLGPVIAEFARVLRPGGNLLIADIHPEVLALGSIPHSRGPDGRPGQVNSYRHLVGDYIRAAFAAGLHLLRCEEPMSAAMPREASNDSADQTADAFELGEPGPWDMWPWTLLELVPEAARAAAAGMPGMLAWHFQAPES